MKKALLSLVLVFTLIFATACGNRIPDISDEPDIEDSEDVADGTTDKDNDLSDSDPIGRDDFNTNKVTLTAAYTKAQSLGFEGTLEEFIEMISGEDGAPGKDGVSVTDVSINTDGQLMVFLSSGAIINCGNVKGNDGAPGKDGTTPTFKIESGILYVSYDKGVKWSSLGKVQGSDGKDGATGPAGATGATIKDITFDEEGRIVITMTNGNVVGPIEIPEREEHKHTFGDWINYGPTENISCEDRMFYHICTECNILEWKKGSHDSHDFKTVTTPPTCVSKGFDTRTCIVCNFAEVINETDTIEHSWDTEYSYDESFHWFGCEHCDATKERKEHTVNNSGYCTECEECLTSSEGIVYKVSEDGTYAIVSDYNGTAERIAIEKEYEGLPVRAIGNWAFAHANAISMVILPNSIVHIGEYSFYSCDGLNSIKIPNSVKNIEEDAFSQCDSLETVIFEENSQLENIADYAFAYSDYLSEIKIPDSVTSIGYRAFNKTAIKNIKIPQNVVSIGTEAFSDCHSLESITVADENTEYTSQNGVLYTKDKTTLLQYPAGKGAEYFYVPYGVTNIGKCAFYSCYNLTGAYMPYSVEVIEESSFAYCENMYYLNLSEGLQEIGADAFFNCFKLEKISIPSSVSSITEGAFFGCLALKEFYVAYANECYTAIDGVLYTKDQKNLLQYPIAKENINFDIPEGVVAICAKAFASCQNLISVTVPASVTTIKFSAFNDCSNLYSVTFEENSRLETIERYAFSSCDCLASFVIPEGVTNIEDVFYSCNGLVSITIPSSVADFGYNTFEGCNKIVEIINYTDYNITPGSDGYGRIAKNALYVHTGDSKIVEYDGFLFISADGVNYLLGYNKTVDQTLILPENYNNGTYEIYKNAFSNRQDIVFLIISDGVSRIGANAFYCCHEITSVTIGKNLAFVENGAFDACYRLFEVINNSSLNIVAGETNNGEIAYNASIVHNGESVINNINDYLFATYDGENYLLNYIGTDVYLTLPDLLNGESYVINDYAFFSKGFIIDVRMSDGVTAVGKSAFSLCYRLRSVTYGENVVSIGDYQFGSCTSIEKIVVSASVEKIGYIFLGGLMSKKLVQIVIENPEGWCWSSDSDFNNVYPIDPDDFSDPFVATRHFVTKYLYCYLTKR